MFKEVYKGNIRRRKGLKEVKGIGRKKKGKKVKINYNKEEKGQHMKNRNRHKEAKPIRQTWLKMTYCLFK